MIMIMIRSIMIDHAYDHDHDRYIAIASVIMLVPLQLHAVNVSRDPFGPTSRRGERDHMIILDVMIMHERYQDQPEECDVLGPLALARASATTTSQLAPPRATEN